MTRTTRISLAATLAALAWAPRALAQKSPRLAPGAVVRVVVVRPGVRDTAVLCTGTLQRLSGDSVTLVSTGIAEPGPHTYVMDDVHQLQARKTSRALTGRGALVGAVAGAAAGYLIGAATWTPCTDTGWFACMYHPSSRSEAGSLGAAAGTLGGAVIGALVGSTMHHDTWGPVAEARDGGAALGVSVRF